MTEEVSEYLTQQAAEAYELLLTLAAIPAPSNHEERRAAFCKDWLERQGARGVFIDEALNVVYPIGCEGEGPITVFMAHTDVVFTDTEALPVVVGGGRIQAPGVGDDTANLVALLMAAKYVTERGLGTRGGKGVLFVANAGEEGLGNLKGSRRICQMYGPRIEEFYSFDGYYDSMTTEAVGSRRYEVTMKTEGGHSYLAFGNRNAIAYLASLIGTLYELKVPEGGKTTYNVGVISGGTSVNTIAQEAQMLYEFRSDRRDDLEFMERHFRSVLEAYRTKGVSVEATLLGERPCTGEVDELRQRAIEEKAREVVLAHTGKEPQSGPGSTDCNSPLSMGIPSVCLGAVLGGGAHTYEEWVALESLESGRKIALELVLHYFS